MHSKLIPLSDYVHLFQALQNGFFNYETFDVDEYEHYEVRLTRLLLTLAIVIAFNLAGVFM